ncbi:hypothetical protein P3H15_54600, partial [Rhodococcus sp. T2V]|uniref:hypothetical protein n=1 Tax=Rhodococcus sp. T2V TaxID=3034164 RepID=UPI0023E1AA02
DSTLIDHRQEVPQLPRVHRLTSFSFTSRRTAIRATHSTCGNTRRLGETYKPDHFLVMDAARV